MNRASSRRLLLISASLLACLAIGPDAPDAAAQYRRAPRFEGKAVPEPPMQGKPWTAPATKLPKFLVTATRLLFEQGVYDPRGCEYRMLEVGDGGIVKTHAFLLPDQGGAAGRHALCWDGLVRPAWSVGGPADLDADMQSLAGQLEKIRDSGARQSDGTIPWSFRVGDDDDDSFGIEDHAPIKLCLLLRLGRADLAEALFAGGTTWTPGPGGRDLTDYKIDYTKLAADWAESAFRLMIGAHIRGEDAIALDLARRLTKFRAAVDKQADAMGFPRQIQADRYGREGRDRFWFLGQLDDLLLDQERRASTPRGPVPKKGGDPKARVEALIRDLDLIAEPSLMYGMASPANSARVGELVAEGDAAVEPLLKALEADDRLTRTVSTGRGFSIERTVHQVQEAEFAALTQILRTSEFDPLRQVFLKKTSADPTAKVEAAKTIREAWEKTRSVPLVERWYRTLMDDSAPPGRWAEVCAAIALPESKWGWPSSRTAGLPPRGEALRARRDPSVSDLMTRRARQLMVQPVGGTLNQGFSGACEITSYLVAWDGKAALPLLKEMTANCHERSDRYKAEGEERSVDAHLAWALAQFIRDRVDLGDASALDDYAAWLRTTTPKMIQYNPAGALIPLYLHPEHPAIAAAARWMFTDPKSPWLPIVPELRGVEIPAMQNFFATPLIVAEGFREGTIAALADRSPYGTILMNPGASVEVKANRGHTSMSGASAAQREGLKPGASVSFRTCDHVASQLSELQGCPRFELFWPEARRDGAIAACVAYLKHYGRNFVNDVTPGWAFAPGHVTLSLKFAAPGRPATREDVAAGRAIFSLEGEGEVRAVRLPAYPQPARWVVLKDKPMDVTTGHVTRVAYDSDGYVWQAEEVRKGDRWERHYGFVGHHVIAKAPASEVEFAHTFGGPFMLTGGLAATLEPADAKATSYATGSPIPIVLRVANRLGVPRDAPTEFVRPGPDGKPALRKGMALKLYYTAEVASERNGFGSFPDEEVAIRRDARFDPGPASRSLAPLESFEAGRLDPADWFDVSRPGRYRLAVKFDSDSGVGEGYGTEVYFQVGGG
jgi:hypothetical protein